MSTKPGRHWLERADVGDVTVARFAVQRLQLEEFIRTIFQQLYGLVDVAHRNRLVLNLGTVEMLTSAAIGKLVMLNRKVQAANGRLALCCLTPTVKEIFDSMRLTDLFHIYPDEQAALQSFDAPAADDEPAAADERTTP